MLVEKHVVIVDCLNRTANNGVIVYQRLCSDENFLFSKQNCRALIGDQHAVQWRHVEVPGVAKSAFADADRCMFGLTRHRSTADPLDFLKSMVEGTDLIAQFDVLNTPLAIRRVNQRICSETRDEILIVGLNQRRYPRNGIRLARQDLKGGNVTLQRGKCSRVRIVKIDPTMLPPESLT